MNALVSGQAGAAVIFDGGQIYSIDVDSPDAAISRSRSDVSMLLNAVTDVTELVNTTRPTVLETLNRAWSSETSLHLCFILLDSEEETATRSMAIEAIDEMLHDVAVRNFIANYLYSAELPSEADIEWARSESARLRCINIASLLGEIGEEQSEIAARVSAWHALREDLFGGREAKEQFRRKAVRAGAFRLFVAERRKRDWALFQLLTDPEFRGSASARRILQAWAASFRETIETVPVRSSHHVGEDSDERETDSRFRRPIGGHEAFKAAERQRSEISISARMRSRARGVIGNSIPARPRTKLSRRMPSIGSRRPIASSA